MIHVHMLAERFRDALAIAAPAVDRKKVLPVLGCYLVEVERDEMRVTATDMVLSIRTTIGATVEGHGKSVFDAKVISDWVNKVSDGEMTIRARERKPGAVVTELMAPPARLEMNQINPDDFPVFPVWEDAKPLAGLDAQTLITAIKLTAFCAEPPSVSNMRPVLESVLIRIAPDRLEFSAADGFRVAQYEVAGSFDVKETHDLIIPVRAVQALARLIEHEAPTTVEFRLFNESRLMARFGPVEWVSGLVDGTFPDVKVVIPKATPDTHHDIRFDADEIKRSLAPLVGIARSTQTKSVLLELEPPADELIPPRMKMSAVDSERSVGEGYLDVQATFAGLTDMALKLNVDYMGDALDVMKGKRLVMRVAGSNSPVLFHPENQDQGRTFNHVVMPMVNN